MASLPMMVASPLLLPRARSMLPHRPANRRPPSNPPPVASSSSSTRGRSSSSNCTRSSSTSSSARIPPLRRCSSVAHQGLGAPRMQASTSIRARSTDKAYQAGCTCQSDVITSGGEGDVAAVAEDEATRLRLDEEARERMRAKARFDLGEVDPVPADRARRDLHQGDVVPGNERAEGDASGAAAATRGQEATNGEDQGGGEQATRGAPGKGGWKWGIRRRIWDMLEERDLARDPRPVHHRIPNFLGAEEAADRLASLPEFQSAQCVKVNPDTPQKRVRLRTLTSEKLLLTPQPRLRSGFFSLVDPQVIGPGRFLECCTSAGVAKHGQPLGLRGGNSTFGAVGKQGQPLGLLGPVDLVVVGSVAVDPISGGRIGKGEGFAELEYGIMRWMGVIDENTPIVTTVRDEQLVPGEIPPSLLLEHDLPVSIICTPTQVIRVNATAPKPTGIYWRLLSPQKLAQVPVLQQLKSLIEAETGQPLPLGPSEELPPTAARNQRTGGSSRNQGGSSSHGGSSRNLGGRSRDQGGSRSQGGSRGVPRQSQQDKKISLGMEREEAKGDVWRRGQEQ